jgi:hypothetical protein
VPALVVALEMQARRRDDAEHALQAAQRKPTRRRPGPDPATRGEPTGFRISTAAVGTVATGWPSVVVQGGFCRMLASPSLARAAIGPSVAAPAARKLFLRKSRRPAADGLDLCSSDRKFSGAGRRRPGCLTISTIETTPPDLCNSHRPTPPISRPDRGWPRDADRPADVDKIRSTTHRNRAALPPVEPRPGDAVPRNVGFDQPIFSRLRPDRSSAHRQEFASDNQQSKVCATCSNTYCLVHAALLISIPRINV